MDDREDDETINTFELNILIIIFLIRELGLQITLLFNKLNKVKKANFK